MPQVFILMVVLIMLKFVFVWIQELVVLCCLAEFIISC